MALNSHPICVNTLTLGGVSVGDIEIPFGFSVHQHQNEWCFVEMYSSTQASLVKDDLNFPWSFSISTLVVSLIRLLMYHIHADLRHHNVGF